MRRIFSFRRANVVPSGCFCSPVAKTSGATLSSGGLHISTTSFKQLPQINIDSIHVFTFNTHTHTHTFQLFSHFHRPAFQAESKHTLPAERGSHLLVPLKKNNTHTHTQARSRTHQNDTPPHKLPLNPNTHTKREKATEPVPEYDRQKEKAAGVRAGQEGRERVTKLI